MRVHNENIIRRQLLRAAILTVRGRQIYNETGDSGMLDSGWSLFHATQPWLQFDGTSRSTTTDTVEYFFAAREALANR